MATIVYDDDDPLLTYTQGTKPLQAEGMIYFGGSGTCTATLADSTGLSIVFSGISISLFGWLSEDLPIDVMVDGKIEPGIQFDTKESKTINSIYQSPNLSDTLHHLTIMPNSLGSPSDTPKCIFVIDYATVVAGENTSLNGKRLIVDESDPSIVFEGGWMLPDTNVLSDSFDAVVRHPYGNAIRQTTSANASASFHFNGTSVSVFGVNDLSSPQSVTVSYNLDGNLTSQVYQFGGSTNFQWYHVVDLLPTDHTLIMTVEDAQNNASFSLDYIIYTPSFSPDPQTTPQNGTTPLHTRHGLSHGALLGAIIGPVLFAAVVVVILLMRRKKVLWSFRQRPNIVNPFHYRRPCTEVSQIRIYHKSSIANGQNVETRVPDCDLPVFQINSTSDGLFHRLTKLIFARWLARIWRRRAYGTLEAFPANWNPSENHRPAIQHKSALPSTQLHALQQQVVGHSDTVSVNETIVADSRVQELEELVISLRREIETLETRQAYGAQNGALMSEMVRSQNGLLNWLGRQGNSTHSSMAMSTTVA